MSVLKTKVNGQWVTVGETIKDPLYNTTGTNEDGAMTQAAVTSALEDIDNKISNKHITIGNTWGTIYYTTFAKFTKTANNVDMMASMIVSAIGDIGSHSCASGVWLVELNGRDGINMKVTTLSPQAAGTVTFGYYTLNNTEYCFGVLRPAWSSKFDIQVLTNPNDLYTIGKIDNSTTAPTGWTAVTPRILQDKSQVDSIVNNYAAPKSHTHAPYQLTYSGATSGGVDPLAAAYMGFSRSNKTFGLEASNINIEYSRDGGTTWLDYEATDWTKEQLFSEEKMAIYLGKSSDKKHTTDYQLRITIRPGSRYVNLRGIMQNISTNGNSLVFKLEAAKYASQDTFTTLIPETTLSGWSGDNVAYKTIGWGTSDWCYYVIRLTYRMPTVSSDYTAATIRDIRFFGDTIWNPGPSNRIAYNKLLYDTPYSVDNFNQATNFIGKVAATNGYTGFVSKRLSNTAAGEARWIRIAELACDDIATISLAKRWTNTSPAILQFSIALDSSTSPKASITQLNATNTSLLSKIRVVHNSSLTGNCFVEVYLNSTSSEAWYATMMSANSASQLYTTPTNGEVPDGFTVTEFTTYNRAMAAKKFVGALEGTATKAKQDANGNVIADTYATKEEVDTKVGYSVNESVDVAGVTKPTYTFFPPENDNDNLQNSGASYFPEGLIMGGTALNAGLVTRGICGVINPDTITGACTKHNLYINYDGTNDYNSERQVVIQAGAIGEHYGNNVYQYCAVRGDSLKGFVETKVSEMVDSAPDTLNTLNELALALGEDPNFATTVATQIGSKVDKTTAINGQELSSDITLTASDVGAVSTAGDEMTGYLNFKNVDNYNAIRKTRTVGNIDHELTLGIGATGDVCIEHYSGATINSRFEIGPSGLGWRETSGATRYTVPIMQYGTTDLTAGSSSLRTGSLYFVYE